jgi:hypothetical protein
LAQSALFQKTLHSFAFDARESTKEFIAWVTSIIDHSSAIAVVKVVFERGFFASIVKNNHKQLLTVAMRLLSSYPLTAAVFGSEYD